MSAEEDLTQGIPKTKRMVQNSLSALQHWACRPYWELLWFHMGHQGGVRLQGKEPYQGLVEV